MQVRQIPPVKITIPNQKVKYLYNHVSDVIKQNKTSATIGTDIIEITADTNVQRDSIINKLISLKAKFTIE